VPTDFYGGAHGVSTSEYPGEMDLSWTAPTSTGGAAVSDYLIEYSADGSSWTTFADGGSTATTASVTGLNDATAYTFRVSAINAAGTGDSSSTATGTTATIPGLVVVINVGSQNPGQMDVCFWYPDWPNYNDGGTVVTHYLVEHSTDSTNWTVADSAVTPGYYSNTCKTFTGLTSGATYMVRATAVNGVGNGPTDTSAQVDEVNSREVCCG
jgi:titin